MDGKFWLYESARPLSLSLSLRRPSVRPVVPPARLLTHPARPPPAPVRGPRRDVPKEEVHGLDADDEDRPSSSSSSGAFCTLVPIRPRSRGERRSLRTFAGASLRPSPLAFNPRPRRLSTSTDAFQLHPDIIARIERPSTSPPPPSRLARRRASTLAPGTRGRVQERPRVAQDRRRGRRPARGHGARARGRGGSAATRTRRTRRTRRRRRRRRARRFRQSGAFYTLVPIRPR